MDGLQLDLHKTGQVNNNSQPSRLGGYEVWVEGVDTQKFGTSTPKDLVLDNARSHHEGIFPKYKQTVSLDDEASGEQNGEGSERKPQGIMWMKEEFGSRTQGLDPIQNKKANDLNSFILGDTDDGSLDQTEVNTKISSLLPFQEERKGIQKTRREGVSVEKLKKPLWPEPTELQLVRGDSMGIHPEIQE